MCGIVGIWQKNPVPQKIIQKMTRILAHRGPDDEGILINKNIGLGHRRLSIIDLTPTGHQPMLNEDKTLAIVYNGEIYNFLHIKKQLQKKGYRFRSTSDTEVILYAYQEWGKDCVRHFNGMWAFVIYDRKKKTFFASRDRIGIKPLYYYFDQEKLILASEIKAILKYPGFKRKVDLAALNEYFTFQNFCSDRTLFDKIKILLPGTNLFYNGDQLRIDKWWQPIFQAKKWSQNELKEIIVSTFRGAIDRHLISDVEIGSFLSGGMDSASIVALASEKNQDLRTFTCGFDLTNVSGMEGAFDERKDAEIVAKRYNTRQYEMVLHSGMMEKSMKDLVWHLEDLRTGICHHEYWIANLAGQFVKVALSGAGGDELFGGYPWRYKIIKNIQKNGQFDKIYYDYWSRLVKDNEKTDFFNKKIAKKFDFSNPFFEYRKIIEPVDELLPLDKAFYFEQKTFLPGILLVADKLSAAFSLEERVPFLDQEMINLSLTIPAALKVQQETGKVILRKAMAKILPREIVNKKKQGFSPPDASWYRDESLPYIKSIILSKRASARQYFNPKFLEKIIREHSLGQKNHRLLIWSLLSFEWWNRIFIDGEKVEGHS
ncbi:MAG: asparagine synthase (glutamine-hydrolyzing) [Patescibacteria group bacterium]